MKMWIKTTPADKAILAYLASRKVHHYQKNRITYFVISRDMDLAESTTTKSLRRLYEQGLITKSHKSWRILGGKESLVQEILAHPFPKFMVETKERGDEEVKKDEDETKEEDPQPDGGTYADVRREVEEKSEPEDPKPFAA